MSVSGSPASRLAALLATFSLFGGHLQAQHAASELEQAVCGPRELAKFRLWSEYAGTADKSRLAGLDGVEEVAVTTRDGRTLRGYKLSAAATSRNRGSQATGYVLGYVLIVQGNAMLADQILPAFTSFAESGLDTYIFDYRGYGRSNGQAGLVAILSDYGEIIEHLDAKGYGLRRFYGMSMGGSVLMNALQADRGEFRAVIDSAPSRLSHHECPERYDPVAQLPKHAPQYMVVVGSQDQVVTPRMSRELFDAARARGASVVLDPQFHHPFQDPHPALRARRMAIVKAFLTGD